MQVEFEEDTLGLLSDHRSSDLRPYHSTIKNNDPVDDVYGTPYFRCDLP